MDIKSSTEQLMPTILAAIAEFEMGIMLERQREGIDIAKVEGKYNGRQPIEDTSHREQQE